MMKYINITLGVKHVFIYQDITKRRKMSVTQKGVDIWNFLPLLIKGIMSLCKFKSAIRIEMLNKHLILLWYKWCHMCTYINNNLLRVSNTVI